MDKHEPDQVIDALGGTTATADLCGLTTGAVSQWRKNGIPRPWIKFLRASRPDVFEESPPTEAENPEAA
jgi:hypothetical protein